MAGKVELARKFKVICVIGLTGHGKSSTVKSMRGVSVSGLTESETDPCSGVLSRWRNESNNYPYIFLDTPGIGDSSRNEDTEHIVKMISALKEVGYVHSFLIVINPKEPRCSEHLQDSI